MRVKDENSGSLFSYVDLEVRVPRVHPLRLIRALTNAALLEMSGEFEALYSRTCRPGIAPANKSFRTIDREPAGEDSDGAGGMPRRRGHGDARGRPPTGL